MRLGYGTKGGRGFGTETRGREGCTDGHAKGARGCATTTPQPPANSAAARRSARSTGSNATTAYNTSPSRSPAVYLAAATLLRSACALSVFLSVTSLSLLPSSSPATDSYTPPLSFTCVHTQGMMRVSLSCSSLSFSLLSLCLSLSISLVADSAREHDSQRAEAKCTVLFHWEETRRRDIHVNAGYDIPTRSLAEEINHFKIFLHNFA